MIIVIVNLRVLSVFECLLKIRGKKIFLRFIIYFFLFILKVIINIILLYFRDILFF